MALQGNNKSSKNRDFLSYLNSITSKEIKIAQKVNC